MDETFRHALDHRLIDRLSGKPKYGGYSAHVREFPLFSRLKGLRLHRSSDYGSVCSVFKSKMWAQYRPDFDRSGSGNAELVSDLLRHETRLPWCPTCCLPRLFSFTGRYNLGDWALKQQLGSRTMDWERTPRSHSCGVERPLLNEEQITGHLYGGDLSRGHGDRKALHQLLPGSEVEVFSAHFRSGRLLQPLLRYSAVRLLGPYTYRLVQTLALEDPSLSQIRVFSYHNVRGEADRFDGNIREAHPARALPRDQR
jgi:hypothetical protein